MKRIKLFEDFKENPQRKQIIKNNDKGGTLIKEDDIVNCISKKGKIWAETIKNIHEFPDIEYKKDDPLTPVDVKGDLVTVDLQNHKLEVNLKDIKKIQY